VTRTIATETFNLGFLTVLHEPSGYLGGYLVTNPWGRPLEFRLSTAVQPNRIQQILYGETLRPYICAELIGKTLVDKAAVAAQLVITDCQPVLDLRLWIDVPVVWLAPAENGLADALAANGSMVRPATDGVGALVCHPRFTSEAPAIRDLLAQLHVLDFAEPFTRIHEAIAEARKMGATSRG